MEAVKTTNSLPKVGPAANQSAFSKTESGENSPFLYPGVQYRIIQPKFSIGSADSIYEKEADDMADKIMRMPMPSAVNFLSVNSTIQRKCAHCEEEEKQLQRKESGVVSNMVAPPIVHDVINFSSGKSLDNATRSFMEPRFNYDFNHVKIHDNDLAAKSASSINALAYTSGNNVVFNSGQYNTNSDTGKRLLAHELTHVVQQSGRHSNASSTIQRTELDEGDERPMTRAEEIDLSRTSPGGIASFSAPPSLSLFNYAIDSADLKQEHVSLLIELANFLAVKGNNIIQVRLIGHADSTGSSSHNITLSKHRASEVKSKLEAAAPKHVNAFWAGEVQPLESNETVEGRSRNRRVDIHLTAQGLALPIPGGGGKKGGGGGGGGTPIDDPGLCEEFPVLCALVGVGILIAIFCILNPEICLPGPPVPPRPPKPPEKSKLPSVVFGSVRATNSPAGMNDRISDKDPVNVMAAVINQPAIPLPITISVANANSNNGNAEISLPNPAVIQGSTLLSVQGIDMTGTVEKPPVLRLQALVDGMLIGESNPFAVSAIMQDVLQFLADEFCVAGDGANIIAAFHWSSDGSRAERSLNEVRHLESLKLVKEEGCFQGVGLGGTRENEDGELLGDIMPNEDRHGTNWSDLIKCGLGQPNKQVIDQFYIMKDLRSGSPYVVIRNSGYRITRTVIEDPRRPGCPLFVTEKEPASTTIKGRSATPGAANGIIRGTCELPCPPEHKPDPLPDPRHDPEPKPSSSCDEPELAKRVDQCINKAKQDAIDCHSVFLTFPPPFGWSAIEAMAEYYNCLRELKKNLLLCDKKAKEDTHCQDPRPVQQPFKNDEPPVVEKCPSCHDLLEESERRRSVSERESLFENFEARVFSLDTAEEVLPDF